MARLAKQFYITSKGERKINCYMVAIPKDVVTRSKVNDREQLNIYAEENRIVIENVRK